MCRQAPAEDGEEKEDGDDNEDEQADDDDVEEDDDYLQVRLAQSCLMRCVTWCAGGPLGNNLSGLHA